MGQAFDDDGNVIGEARGDTKREVFEKLNQAHPDAAEMRIKRDADEQAPGGQTPVDQGDGAGDAER